MSKDEMPEEIWAYFDDGNGALWHSPRPDQDQSAVKYTRADLSTPVPDDVADGDYVLATKFHDGDAADPWAIGFYAGKDKDRHFVKDSEGKQIRLNGFRRVQKISDELGNWLYANRVDLERMASQTTPDIFNLWMIAEIRAASTPSAEAVATVSEEDKARALEAIDRWEKLPRMFWDGDHERALNDVLPTLKALLLPTPRGEG